MKQLVILIALTSVALSNAATLYAPPKLYSAGAIGTSSVVLADVNRDGKLDVVLANSGCNQQGFCPQLGSVAILLGNGDGSFRTAATYPTSGIATSLAVADLNGDGLLDIAVASQCRTTCNGEGSVDVMLGKGDGTFQSAIGYPSGGLASSVAIADVNGDGKADLLLTNGCLVVSTSYCVNSSVGVLLGYGDGTFKAVVAYGSGTDCCANSITVADVNRDGNLDLVVANGKDCIAIFPEVCPVGLVGVLLGNGDGTFQTALTYSSGAYDATAILVKDLNADGIPDMLVTNGFLSNTGNNVCCHGGLAILLGLGDGSFQESVVYPSDGGFPDALSQVDVHGDGTLSVVIANSNRNNGQGKLSIGYDVNYSGALYGISGTGGYFATSVAVGDLNGDGRNDIVAGNACEVLPACTYGSVAVRLRQPIATKTTVSSSNNPSFIKQTVVFTASITSTVPIPDGQIVTFYDGSVAVGIGATSFNRATFTISSLSAKSHIIRAAYPGNFDLGSSAGTISQNVILYPSSTLLTASPNPSNYGQSVSLTATVSSSALGGPTGTVTFKNGTASLGTASLKARTAVLGTTKLPIGTATITVIYSGDTSSGKSSTTMTQVVNP